MRCEEILLKPSNLIPELRMVAVEHVYSLVRLLQGLQVELKLLAEHRLEHFLHHEQHGERIQFGPRAHVPDPLEELFQIAPALLPRDVKRMNLLVVLLGVEEIAVVYSQIACWIRVLGPVDAGVEVNVKVLKERRFALPALAFLEPRLDDHFLHVVPPHVLALNTLLPLVRRDLLVRMLTQPRAVHVEPAIIGFHADLSAHTSLLFWDRGGGRACRRGKHLLPGPQPPSSGRLSTRP
mmetsp:Transcript_18197/g.44692  ORF Transcript_18197/g.44692 Transcript_18197/m.44692 type:complete len:237 (+) Transcript_18197:2913-3623(+)